MVSLLTFGMFFVVLPLLPVIITLAVDTDHYITLYTDSNKGL